MVDGSNIKTVEPHAFDLELQANDAPLFVAFLKRNERFVDQSTLLKVVAAQYGDRVSCYLYDADYLDTAMDRFEVKGTPTFLLFSDGHEVGRLMGEPDKATLDDFISKLVSGK